MIYGWGYGGRNGNYIKRSRALQGQGEATDKLEGSVEYEIEGREGKKKANYGLTREPKPASPGPTINIHWQNKPITFDSLAEDRTMPAT